MIFEFDWLRLICKFNFEFDLQVLVFGLIWGIWFASSVSYFDIWVCFEFKLWASLIFECDFVWSWFPSLTFRSICVFEWFWFWHVRLIFEIDFWIWFLTLTIEFETIVFVLVMIVILTFKFNMLLWLLIIKINLNIPQQWLKN